MIYLRCTHYGDRVEIRDVTEAVLRYSRGRVKRSKANKAELEQRQRDRILRAVRYKPKAGSPTPERRRRATDEGGAFLKIPAPKREAASDPAVVYEIPSHLSRLHRNGKITNNMLHAAA